MYTYTYIYVLNEYIGYLDYIKLSYFTWTLSLKFCLFSTFCNQKFKIKK